MAVSSGLSRILLGLGQGYMNARNQGRRERQNLITTNARLKSDKQRNAIELAKLTSAEEDRRLKREADAAGLRLKDEEFRQKALGDAGLELDRGMKRLEGRSGDELDTGIHQLRGGIMGLYGQNTSRPWGITQDQLDRMLAAPGSVIPGVFERKVGAGNLVNPDYGSDPTTAFYDPQSIQEIYGADTPTVGQSMAVRPEGSRNFMEFTNTPVDDTTKNLMGLMNQGAANFYGGKINAPQNFGDMMSMKPDDAYRSPEAVQQATKAQFPDSVMISREREATTKEVPMTAKYGMRETDQSKIAGQQASSALANARTTSLTNKLGTEIDLMKARINKLGMDTRLGPIKAAATRASQALGYARLKLASMKEDNLNRRHSDMMGYRYEDMDRKRDEQRTLNVRGVYSSMIELNKSITMAEQEKARIMSNPNFSNTAQGKNAINGIDEMIGQMSRQRDQINDWGVAETGSPIEWSNIGLTGSEYETQGFLTDNPLMQAMGYSMRVNPGAYGRMGTSHDYDINRESGWMQGVGGETTARAIQRSGAGRGPDSAGMMGGAGYPTGGSRGGKPQPQPGPSPKGDPFANMSRQDLFNAVMADIKKTKTK
jgi:hypothetical protein